MAEKIVSPGVFTRENDLSYLPQGISQIGAAIIGPTSKGPAFIPTLVESYNDFVKFFGDTDGTSYVPYTVKNYLKNSGRATIVRVVGSEGYNSDSLTLEVLLSNETGSFAPVTGSDDYVYTKKSLFVLVPTAISSSNYSVADWAVTFATNSVDFTLSSGSYSYSLSYNPSSANYVTNVFGSSPNGQKLFYVYDEFKTTVEKYYDYFYASSSFVSMSVSIQNDGVELSGSGYSYAETPYIQSQTISGEKYPLFSFVTFNCGEPDIKISIEDIKTPSEVINSDYGSFTVVVRSIDDTDARQNVLELFPNCNINPDSPNYIARQIGDQSRDYIVDGAGDSKLIISGDYTNNSKYIRVSMDQYINTVPVTAIPFGFDSYSYPVKSVTNFPALSVITTQLDSSGDWNYRTHLGFDFTTSDNNFVLDPVVSTAGLTSEFSLESCYFNSASVETIYSVSAFPSLSDISIKSRKFTVGFFGGYDALNPTTLKNMGLDITTSNVMGFDCSDAQAEGTLAFRKAIDTVANPDEFDINMLVLPGINIEDHGSVVTYANTMCEDRQDTFFLFDCVGVGSSKTVTTAVNSVSGVDSNYSATYYPWVKIFDSVTNKYLWVPPSVVMAGVIAFNDRVAAEWYAPAGLNRGGITEAVAAFTRLTQAERDELYENRVNPLATFVGQGVVAWGQKTLQAKSSALDRINVRRLLIKIKKYIASTTKYLVFEQNTAATRDRFLNIANPYLENIQQRQGLYTFKVVMDTTNNTPDVIDRNQMKGEIYLQPARSAEMIIIDFNITRTGATFSA
jgi:hypothetical protein